MRGSSFQKSAFIVAAITAIGVIAFLTGAIWQSLIVAAVLVQIGTTFYLARQITQTREGLGSLKPLFDIAYDRDILTVHDHTGRSLPDQRISTTSIASCC